MEKKIEEMTLLEAVELLEALQESGNAYTEKKRAERGALYKHILTLCKFKTGGEG